MVAKKGNNSKKTIWLGGAIGVVVCALLFLFYQFVYFPAFQTADNDTDPSWLLIPPTITGHVFPFTSHFLIEGFSVVNVFCRATNPECVLFATEHEKDCTKPWVSEDPDTGEKTAGCCLSQIMTPDESCAEKVDIAGFIGLTILLAIVYFIVGALIAQQIQKKRR